MYAKFEGSPFLKEFLKYRNWILDSIQVKTKGQIHVNDTTKAIIHQLTKILPRYLVDDENSFPCQFKNLLFETDCLNQEELKNHGAHFKQFDPDRSVETEPLLFSLLSTMCYSNGKAEIIKLWIDRLVQRFEVTKKIYESYQPGFRKGAGKNDVYGLYVLFSVILSKFYHENKLLKYLNTLIKVNDLLCSISDEITESPNLSAMSFLSIMSETYLVTDLIRRKEIQGVFN
jgi:hypothetical protein